MKITSTRVPTITTTTTPIKHYKIITNTFLMHTGPGCTKFLLRLVFDKVN
jgi:hypothetical protein